MGPGLHLFLVKTRGAYPIFQNALALSKVKGIVAHSDSALSNLWKSLQVFLTACSLLWVLSSPPAPPGQMSVPLLCAEFRAHGGVTLTFAHFTAIAQQPPILLPLSVGPMGRGLLALENILHLGI